MERYDAYRSNVDAVIPGTMQAVVARGAGFENLAVERVAVPAVGPDQLLARVDAAGVCTSILKLIAQGPEHTYINGWDMAKWPVILGDEGAVTVVKVGAHLADRYRPGQRFAIQPAVGVSPILHRERYKNGGEGMHKCAVGYTLGGHLAEYILVQEEVLAAECLLPLPCADMGYYAVSMAEPISCIYSAQDRHYHVVKDGPHAARRGQLGLLPGGVAVVVGA
ncbi:MAG: alcohol dehydrogenase catalytic domain-containing protein, partial [Phycisphaerae bacterium]|nr:alcohol dehydrogenase catalytic domain-containing protein [Phycisphaerae bacterium]